jgi:prepilin-type N-terminal cleavage/methylation domain-containing protein
VNAPRDNNPRARTRRTRGERRRRGMTMLEVVFAVVLLGLVATSAASLFGLLTRLHTDNAQRAAAYELANRIILQYLDDPKECPSEAEALPYGPWRFRFHLDERPVRMVVKQTEAAARTADKIPMNRFRMVTVRVWIVAEGTEWSTDIAGEEMASLTRIYDPLSAMLFRNPDARERRMQRGDQLQELMRLMTEGAGAAPQPERSGGGSR